MQYFTLSEFDSPDLPGSGSRMQPQFLDMLDDARDLAGIPFIVNSGYRTVAHNKEVGGTTNSSHLVGCAADIAVRNSSQRFIIVASLIAVGFTRIDGNASFDMRRAYDGITVMCHDGNWYVIQRKEK